MVLTVASASETLAQAGVVFYAGGDDWLNHFSEGGNDPVKVFTGECPELPAETAAVLVMYANREPR